MKQKLKSVYALLVSKAYTLITERMVVVQTDRNSDLDNVLQLHSLKAMRSLITQHIKELEKTSANNQSKE
jgi:hypothetical protein